MQSKTGHIVLVVAAAALAVVAFVVLNPSGGGDDDGPAETTAGAETERTGGPAGGGRRPDQEGSEEPPQGETPVVRIRNGELVGGVEEIQVEHGGTVEFAVTSDAPDEIHVHGYEVTERVTPHKPARFRFEADAEGIYEVEAHDIGHVVVAEIRVVPA